MVKVTPICDCIVLESYKTAVNHKHLSISCYPLDPILCVSFCPSQIRAQVSPPSQGWSLTKIKERMAINHHPQEEFLLFLADWVSPTQIIQNNLS